MERTLRAARRRSTGAGITNAYRWLRCDENVADCIPITSATDTEYELVSADLDSTIRGAVLRQIAPAERAPKPRGSLRRLHTAAP